MQSHLITCALVTSLIGSNSFAQDTSGDQGDHPKFAHAMAVNTRSIQNAPVVFQYGEVRPSFDALQGNSTRKRTSLDGEWQLRFEDNQKTHSITVPHCWGMMKGSSFWKKENSSSDNPARYTGAGWYRKAFEVNPASERRYRLEFRGVRERARILLNGKEIAMHEGLGAPFSLDVTASLRPGKNEIRLKVLRHTSYRKDAKGKWQEVESTHTPYPKAPDYWPYAGITGSVALWEEAQTTIRKIQTRTKDGHLQLNAIIANQSSDEFKGELVLSSEILPNGSHLTPVTIPAGEVIVIQEKFALQKGTKHWSPDSPVLHKLSAQLRREEQLIDSSELKVGLREFETRGKQLILNGEPIFLKGVAAYSDTPQGLAITEAEHRNILSFAKKSGANFVRLPVRQRDPIVYQLADEMGLMLSGEWGGFWYKEKSMDAQTKDKNSIFQSMGRVAVWDLMNHPSVVLWCTNNECHQFCPEYEPFIKMNRSLVREIDGGMLPITWAAWHPHSGQPCFQYADIVGFNEYRGAHDSFKKLLPDMKKTVAQNPNKPLIILENGAWAKLGHRGGITQRSTEDWQDDLLKRQFKVLKNFSPPLAGYTYWILQDYRSAKHYTAHKNSNGWSGMGIYAPSGEAKLVEKTFQEIEFPNPDIETQKTPR